MGLARSSARLYMEQASPGRASLFWRQAKILHESCGAAANGYQIFQNAAPSNDFCVLATKFPWIIFNIDIVHGLLYLCTYYRESVIVILWCVFVGSVSRVDRVNVIA